MRPAQAFEPELCHEGWRREVGAEHSVKCENYLPLREASLSRFGFPVAFAMC